MTSNGAHLEMTSPSDPASSENVDISATVIFKGRRYRQRQLGPAPFASFEDLSDELDSPPETARVPLPGIREDPSSQLQSPNSPLPSVTGINITEKEQQFLKESLVSSLDTPALPRIDISRASSSSQHEDSITSSPERENGTHNLGYREDGTIDLRSSTEELDYIQEPGTVQESEEKRKREKRMKRQQQVRDFGDTQSQHEFIGRKDSNCSVISDSGLLNISGRTSRLSSIGSAASGSVASDASHLSAGSGRSTRSPSPHKMLLETSFCGSKPVHSHGGEQETSSSLAAAEKPASRPPSRLRSRSPSPHKMLLETSFCGTKQILPPETETQKELPKTLKKKKLKTNPAVVTEADIAEQRVSKKEAVPQQQPVTAEEVVAKTEKLQPVKQDQTKPCKSKNDAVEKTKKQPVISKKPVSKPRKVISIRDIPGDEIFIPLKGPELDFEEIIRRASPNVQKKVEKPSYDSPNEIFIPLHSPPKTSPDQEVKDESSYSASKSCKGSVSNKPNSHKVTEVGVKITTREKQQKVKQEPKKRGYEICEDGSIFIPLHSPDEDLTNNNFEDKIKRVDQELQKAKEAAERKLKDEEEERQRKPETLDLSDSGSHKTRLTSGKSEIPSGGSRTPSPGSTLSRKSSFASLFRKSDVFSSPDSQSSSTVRKKSGTFSNILKEASDGLRERSRSRSKSKERQFQSSTPARSPSSKKNVFSNLFAKKKAEARTGSGKENEQLPSRLDLQFSFPANNESKKAFDEGDYIIIPLRDPSDPYDSLDIEHQQEQLPLPNELGNHKEKPPSPLIHEKKSESLKPVRKNADSQVESVEISKISKSSSKDSLGSGRKIESVERSKRTSSGTKTIGNSPKESLNGEYKEQTSTFTKQFSDDDFKVAKQRNQESMSDSGERESIQRGNEVGNNTRLQHDSSTEIDEKNSKEDILIEPDVEARKLKLPPEPGDSEEDHERKGLVYQESFEDELPYVPTTLPLERPVGVQIVPVKHRVNEIKTCSIERPRSTTPINPTTLEDFVTSKETIPVKTDEKMKISLPRENSITSKSKSPTRYSGKGKTWFEFAETALQSPRDGRKSSLRTTPSPPPLPPRSSPPSVLSSSAPPTTTSWINFEELPEKRKLPKRITTVPTLRSSADGGEKSSGSVSGGVVYSYVSPEDCQCECHDHNTSHSKESDHERGHNNNLTVELKPNNEFKKKGFVNKSKTSTPEKNIEKSGCKDCESGIYTTAERDIEETPLLDVNSDEEDEYRAGPASSDQRTEGHFDKALPLSDSSCEDASQEVLFGAEQNYRTKDTKPFGMDLEVDNSRNSSFYQDIWSSPEDKSPPQ